MIGLIWKIKVKINNFLFSKKNNMVNAQEWLEEYYPENRVCKEKNDNDNFGKRRSEITKLDISKKNLAYSLKLKGFNNLTTLFCFNNQLTELDVNSCTGLNTLYCYDNKLTKLELSNCTNLTGIICNNSQLTDLTIFSKLVSCEWIDLDNNPFTGFTRSIAINNITSWRC